MSAAAATSRMLAPWKPVPANAASATARLSSRVRAPLVDSPVTKKPYDCTGKKSSPRGRRLPGLLFVLADFEHERVRDPHAAAALRRIERRARHRLRYALAQLRV